MSKAIGFLLVGLLAGCVVPVQSNDPNAAGGGGYPSGGGEPAPAPAETSGGEAPAGPVVVSVTIRSACSQTVRVFYGDKPKFGSGTYSSISSNSVQSKSFQAGDMVWIVDGSDNGVASVTVTDRTREIEVSPSCDSLHER
jgi:hypothetical protein